ncbi:DUF2165 domain-containing protein [Streptomyces sp. NBC_01239]|uniref:DUF2165 domain-containing protein n=1 Tax=Streptomyces sp. NBC_01239 TaxID=2903792 RepID=UPI00225A658F|nr:DUF2165 domain-containing protein [Streptomyces sp. NBC_01239]MCX4812974.1 DUF2165 domain-containing protein [Streptomyces sp. NBC_01239]
MATPVYPEQHSCQYGARLSGCCPGSSGSRTATHLTATHLTATLLTATLLTATVALYIALVAFGNITDFGTNQQFVQHVLAMDTTFKDDDLMWRAVTGKGLRDAAHVVIIVWETVAALVSTYGLLMLMVLFGAGFIAVGGEWFAMWQSKDWNRLDAATRVFLLSGVVLVVVQLTGERSAT